MSINITPKDRINGFFFHIMIFATGQLKILNKGYLNILYISIDVNFIINFSLKLDFTFDHIFHLIPNEFWLFDLRTFIKAFLEFSTIYKTHVFISTARMVHAFKAFK